MVRIISLLESCFEDGNITNFTFYRLIPLLLPFHSPLSCPMSTPIDCQLFSVVEMACEGSPGNLWGHNECTSCSTGWEIGEKNLLPNEFGWKAYQ